MRLISLIFAVFLISLFSINLAVSVTSSANHTFYIQGYPPVINPPSNEFCTYYTNKTACENDRNLQNPIGDTFLNNQRENICGRTVVSQSDLTVRVNGCYLITNCKCEWVGTSETSGSCNNAHTPNPTNRDICEPNNNGGDNSYPKKCLRDYSPLGECTNGVQTYFWTSTAINLDTNQPINYNTAPSSVKSWIDNYCRSSESPVTRTCGKPTIALPGFSFFALISSITIIIFIYIIRIKKDEK